MKLINIFKQSVPCILTLLAGRTICSAGTETGSTQPNFLIIMVDDMGMRIWV